MRSVVVMDCMGHAIVSEFCPLAEPRGVRRVCRHAEHRNDPTELVCNYDNAAGIERPQACPLDRIPEALIVQVVEI
jgi:hypothetical protein